MRRGMGVCSNGLITKGLAELIHPMSDGYKQARDGVAGEGQWLSEEDESRINEDIYNVNGGCIELVEAQVALQRQQPREPVVQWERFLPLRSLKVLLVENNDSTRHVVTGLLENCSYEVTAVENGLEAWKIIEDLTNHIDLVLTEVVVPCLSGVALLSKIKNHNTCKNIPVIMMSSNDSMGIVFKCLSKGAVDFLVKPIRKNELQNLWLHVWRKCHSSSSSASGSGIRTQKPMKSKSIEESHNDTGSNNENDNGSVSLNLKDGSDKGSGTQSSWSKKVVEIDRPQQMTLWDQLADPADSTCAQATHSRLEAFSSNWGPRSAAAKECHLGDNELDCVAMGKDLEIGLPRNPDYLSKEVLKNAAGTEKDNFVNLHSEENGEKLEESLELKDETANDGMGNETADLIMGSIVKSSNPNMEAVVNEPPNNPSKTTNINVDAIYVTEELPSLELSLKRQRDVGDTRTIAHERNVLRHSELSAFSRYNTSNPNQALTWNVGNCSPLYNNSSEAAKTESMHNLQSKSNSPPNQRSNDSSNNDMGSTNNVFTIPEVLSTDEPIPRSTVSIRPSAFHPVHHDQFSSLHEIPTKAITITNTVLGQENANKKSVKVHHHHHHYHHHHHHAHNTQQQKQKASNDDDLSLRNMVASASHRQSDLLTGLVEGNAANYGLNRSGSGSINRNNGENGSSGKNGNSSLGAIADETNMVSDNGVSGKYGADDMSGSGNGSRSGVDQDRLALREAALIKFRLKRKERCFEKKVRYHSRKKLAEQRPRVRGQFVRQAVNENKDRDR